MFFTTSLYIALAIFGLGLLYKVSTWFRYSVGGEAGEISPLSRLLSAVRGIFLTVFSPKILTLLKVFVLDVSFNGNYANVLTDLQFERMLSPTGPTDGLVVFPREGRL